MVQIKISLSEKEKAELEKKAAKSGKSVSAYSREILCSRRTNKRNIDRTKLKSFTVTLPPELIQEIKDGASENGMSVSAYVDLILSQQGKPVIVRFNYLDSTEEIAKLNRFFADIDTIATLARTDGVIYESDLKSATAEIEQMKPEFIKAVNDLTRRQMTIAQDTQKALNREIEKAKEAETKEGDTNGNS